MKNKQEKSEKPTQAEERELPDWYDDPPDVDYALECDHQKDGEYIQYVALTREEYIKLKDFLLQLRGYSMSEQA